MSNSPTDGINNIQPSVSLSAFINGDRYDSMSKEDLILSILKETSRLSALGQDVDYERLLPRLRQQLTPDMIDDILIIIKAAALANKINS